MNTILDLCVCRKKYYERKLSLNSGLNVDIKDFLNKSYTYNWTVF